MEDRFSNYKKEFHRYLFRTAQDITTVLRKGKQGSNWFLNEIIDGPYDVDKLDYINRDSYHCGTKEYGTVDYERIIDGFRVVGQ